MKTNNNKNWIVYVCLLVGGGLLGYFYKISKDIDYEQTLTVANIGDKAYNAVQNVKDIWKILTK